VGDYGDHRSDDVGGVEAAAHAYLQDGQVNVRGASSRLGEKFESHGSQKLEKRREPGENRFVDKPLSGANDLEVDACKCLIGDVGQSASASAAAIRSSAATES